MNLPTFLPGTLTLERGTPADYRALETFHYISHRPATWAGVWVVRYTPGAKVETISAELQPPARLVAVGVLSWPVPTCVPRENHFHLRGRSFGERLRFANANLRTISRVVVHPQFRSLGLAGALVRCLCAQNPTRFTEALAMMSQAHPLFEAGGMTRVGENEAYSDAPVYFLHERAPHCSETTI